MKPPMLELKSQMPKLWGVFLSCLEERQAIEPVLPELSNEAGVVEPSLAESSSSVDILEKEPEAAAMIDFSNNKPCFHQVKGELVNVRGEIVLRRFLTLLETGLSGVSFVWEDIFKDPFSSKLLDVSHIPQHVYVELAQWVKLLMEDDDELCKFVLWTFNYIVDSVSLSRKREKRFQNVSIFLALAMILRMRPFVLFMKSESLVRQHLDYERSDILATPLTVWMTHQVSKTNLRLGLHSWTGHSTTHTQSTKLIIQVAEKIMAEPEAQTFVTDPYVEGVRLIPPPSVELLLRFRFPYTREEEDKARVERIYTWLKDVALSGAPEMDDSIQQIFTVSFGLLGEKVLLVTIQIDP